MILTLDIKNRPHNPSFKLKITNFSSHLSNSHYSHHKITILSHKIHPNPSNSAFSHSRNKEKIKFFSKTCFSFPIQPISISIGPVCFLFSRESLFVDWATEMFDCRGRFIVKAGSESAPIIHCKLTISSVNFAAMARDFFAVIEFFV